MDATPLTPTVTLTITSSKDESNGTPASNNSINVPSASLKTQKIRGRIQLTALCWSFFLLGWNDSSTGPLLPRMTEAYQVGISNH